MLTYSQLLPDNGFTEYNKLLATTTELLRTFTHSSPDTISTNTISIILPDTFHLQLTSKAAAAVAVCNPINPRTDWQTMATILQAAQTAVLVTAKPSASNTIWPKVEQAVWAASTVSTILYVDMQPYLPLREQMLTQQFPQPRSCAEK